MEVIQALVRVLQLLWLLLLTALIGNVIATNVDSAGSAMAAIDFSMFVIVFSWLAAFFGLAASLTAALSFPVVLLAVDGAAVLFTFIDAVVLSAKLGAANCAATATAGHPSYWIAFGSGDDEKRCREIQAAAVFMWFLFLSFVAGTALYLIAFRRSGGSVRSGVPTMSQVHVGV